MTRAYYNEIDLDCCGALQALMDDGLIAPGTIDSRSIKDIMPDDFEGFTQIHLCAGIGVWSYAARLAGWPDERPLWTASFPCQPFSAAGKQAGTDDPRHLWPDGLRLIRARRPAVVMGEQVAGALGYGWFDGVRSDLEGEDYACRAVDIPACSADAPHIRNRLAWIAQRAVGDVADGDEPVVRPVAPAGEFSDVQQDARDHGDSDGERLALTERADERRRRLPRPGEGFGALGGRSPNELARPDDRNGVTMGDTERARLEGQRGHGDGSGREITHRSAPAADDERRNGTFWSDSEWLLCHDQKARRAKPGIRLLVDGAPARIPRWRAAGNTICAPLFAEVIKAYLETEMT